MQIDLRHSIIRPSLRDHRALAQRLLLLASIGLWTLSALANTVISTLPSTYQAGVAFTVTNRVAVDASVAVYAVEDGPPAGWTVSNISTGGTFDPVQCKVKWGLFFDNLPRTLTYQVTPPSNATGLATFNGLGVFDLFEQASITGQRTSLARSTFTNAVVATLTNRFVPGVPILVSLALKIGAGVQVVAVEESPPTGWSVSAISDAGVYDVVNGKVKWGPFLDGISRTLSYLVLPPSNALPAVTFSGSGYFDQTHLSIEGQRTAERVFAFPGTVVRNLSPNYTPGQWLGVTNVATPASNAIVFAVEDSPPPDWLVTNISHNGWFDALHRKVKWGPFFTNAALTLSYETLPPFTASGLALFNGTGSFDQAVVPIAGPGETMIALSPAGSVLRTFDPSYSPGVSFWVTNLVLPANGINAFAVEETPPPGWIVTEINEGGLFDPVQRRVKWGPFFAATPMALLYRVTPPLDAAESVTFVGAARFENRTVTIAGQTAAARFHPFRGRVQRALPETFSPGSPFLVTNAAAPATNIEVYAVEEIIPTGWTASGVSDGGAFDAFTGKVKWGPFFDHTPRSLTYLVRSPAFARSGADFSGVASFDTAVVTIEGAHLSLPLGPPVLTLLCPPDKRVNTDPGLCTASGVTLGDPSVSSVSAIAAVLSNAPAAFPIGTNIVTWTVTDTSGNINSCDQRVIVEDHQNPVVICPANISTNEVPAGAGQVVVTYSTPAGIDNCPGTTTVCVPPSGMAFAVGTTTIHCTSTDASGNTGGCGFTITVSAAASVPAPGLSLWLRADAGVVTNSPEITQWQDQSGQGRHAVQAASANQPVFKPSAVNGLPAIHFDGLNDFFTFNLPVNGLNEMTIFMVAANTQNQGPGTVQAERAALFWNETAGWGTLYLTPFQSSVALRFGTTQAGNLVLYNRPQSVGSAFTLTSAMKNGTTDSLRINKTPVVSQGGKLTTVAGCRASGNLGRGYNDNTFFDGDIAELLIYSRALTALEQDAVENYLDRKYNLTAPPIAQPPVIQTQPAGVTVLPPAAATFAVLASGAAPLHYQWRRGAASIAGANSASYTLTATTASDNGAQFSVVITNAVGSVTSLVATLTVVPAGSMPTADLALWLRGDVGTVLNGQALTQWSDQSGNNRHATQAGPTEQPVLVAAGLNGRPTLRFDGSNDFLNFTLPVNGLTGMTLFMVAANRQNQSPGATQAERAALFWNETASWGALYLTPFQSSVALRFGTTQSGNLMLYPRPVSMGNSFTLSTAIKNGGTDTLRINKTQVLSQGGKLGAIAGCRNTGTLARGYNDDTFFAGDIAEVLVYTRALTTVERDTVEDYLDGKYALTSPSAPQAPTIQTQPSDVSVIVPSAASFSISASGSLPLAYRWRREGVDLAGQTGSTLTLSPTSTADHSAHFDVVIANSVGAVTSVVATLTVTAPGTLPAASLELWLRADLGTIVNSSGVTQWSDQSGKNRHALQGSADNEPVRINTVLNGLPVVRFDGINDFLTFNFPINGLTGLSIFLVAANTQNQVAGATLAERAALFWNETSSWGTVHVSPFQSRINFRFGTTQPNNQPVFNRPLALGNSFSVTAALKSGTTDSLYVNGSQVLSQGGKLATIAGCQTVGNVGRGYNNNSFFAGDIAEVIIYSRALSAGELQTVSSYLANKYALPLSLSAGLSTFVSEPRLRILFSPGGELQLILTGQAGQSYQVETSSDLRNWSTTTALELPLGSGSSGSITVSREAAASYFRARQQ